MTSPAVYLDHWALRDISEDQTLSKRFTSAILSRQGTLCLSWLNLVEFTKVTDIAQGRAAEELIESVLPNVFFFEVNPFTVIESEDRLLAGSEPFPPHADTGFLRAFVSLSPKSPRPFTARNLFTIAQESNLSARLEALADTAVERIGALRDTFLADRSFRSQVKRLPSGPAIQHGTRYILRELVRPMLLDQATNIGRNHAIDLLHAVVPVSYCDIVLLDKHWEVQVGRMNARLIEAKMTFPVARVFSRRSNRLDHFLVALEGATV